MSKRYLRLKGVQQMVPYSRSSLYRKIASGEFPQPIKLGGRAVAWDEAEIDAWIAERRTESLKIISSSPREERRVA